MRVMSLPPQPKANPKRTGKRISFFNEQGAAMKETSSQHPEGSYYALAAPASEAAPSEAASTVSSNPDAPHMYLNSVIFSPEKGDQNRGHYQQTLPMKWANQEPSPQSQQQQQRAGNWTQGVTMANWGQNFAPYLGGVSVGDVRTQASFAKQGREGPSLQPQPQPPSRAPEKQQLVVNPTGEAYREVTKPHGLDWDPQNQPQHQAPQQPQGQAQVQAYQQPLKPGALNAPQHSVQSPGGTSVLQPFQLAFGQPKQNLTGYYQAFQGSRALPNLNYGGQAQAQAKPQPQLQPQPQSQPQPQPQPQPQSQPQPQPQPQLQPQPQHMQKKEQEQIQRQQILQQQIQQQHHIQQQQMLQHQQHVQQQQQQQQQIQQRQQQLQQQQQKQQQQQQQQQQKQQQQIQQQLALCGMYYSSPSSHPHAQPLPQPQPPVVVHSQEPPAAAPPTVQEPAPPTLPSDPQPASDAQPHQPQAQPRRSRRLSKEGGAPSGENPFLLPSEQSELGSQNGGAPEAVQGPPRTEEVQAAPTGVIQSTRRKRRVSQEVNLETLAQKASEMESLPSHGLKDPHRPWSPSRAGSGPDRLLGPGDGLTSKRPRDDSMLPLVIPVSVPVRRQEPSSSERERAALSSSWPLRHGFLDSGLSDHKPSVIVTRRRSLRNSLSESSGQNGGMEGDKDDDGKSAKSKRRPRPEPLFIPPPKPGTFIAPPIYSSITPYQSHLRSPVRLVDNPLAMPPYTPPPILSPVREGSGLYFSTFLSSAAASAQGLPPPATPKSASRSLLRSNSCDITPPVLSAIGEATPVSIEPRINIGVRYQAEVPELRAGQGAQHDPHLAELLWAPLGEALARPAFQEKVDDLMHLACSSALCGGGTNQELALHCLYECKGDIMGALALLLLKSPVFPKAHRLAGYHYSGSDSWTAAERRCFNKGIAAYKKDFFMVQKLVSTKTVAQCVEFYYTYKKHVKMGRNGALLYGEAEPPETRTTDEELDHKSSHRLDNRKEEEDNRKWEGSADRKPCGSSPGRITQTLQASDNVGAVLVLKGQEDVKRDQPSSRAGHPHPPPSKPRAAAAAKPPPNPTGQEGEFPCKKCGRVFFKVKSRSAHMKSHAEQEKKAAALRQKEAEERAAAEAAALLAARHNGALPGAAGGDSTNDDTSEDDGDRNDEDWH